MTNSSLKRAARLGLPLALTLLASACVVVPAHRYPARSVYYEQPAPVSEQRPTTGNWVPGHYVFDEGRGWVWVAGHYVQAAVPAYPAPIQEVVTVAPTPAHVYVRGYWFWGGVNWRWRGGHWAARGRW
jgi:hypothetical protein